MGFHTKGGTEKHVSTVAIVLRIIEVHYRFIVWAVQNVLNYYRHAKLNRGFISKWFVIYSTATKQKDGGFADTKVRELVVRKLNDIKTKVYALSRKELNTATLIWKKELTSSMIILIIQTS